MTRAARFHEVGEAVKDSAPDGASEWWLFTCGGGILWWRCGARAPLDGAGDIVVTGLLGGGGGGGGHTSNLVIGEIWPASLASVHDARVPVGQSGSMSSASLSVVVVRGWSPE
jgi:hypothetical protein